MSGDREGEKEAPNSEGPTYSVQDAIDAVGFGRYQKALCAIVGLVYMCVGLALPCGPCGADRPGTERTRWR